MFLFLAIMYTCVDGYSPNWGTEYYAARGGSVGQVLYEEPGTQISEWSCRALCETYDAAAYNWKDDTPNDGCRCYAANALTFTPEGSSWQFCLKGINISS